MEAVDPDNGLGRKKKDLRVRNKIDKGRRGGGL